MRKKISDFDPGNITGKYILVNKKPVACPDLMKWAKWMEKGARRVARDTIHGVIVSTVFLGLDHAFVGGHAKPVLFETMLKYPGKDNFSGWGGYQKRYHTWSEAVKGHKKAIGFVKFEFKNLESVSRETKAK